MKKGKLALIGLTVSIFVLAIVVSTTLVSKNTKMAYADELAHKSYEAVSMLTPEQQEELKQKVQFDNPKDLLQVAKEAQDLEVITYSQFMNQYFQQFMSGQGPQGPTIDISKLKFLQFTDKEGKRNVIGINDNNLPVIMLSLSGNSNTSEQPSSGTFRRPEGEAIPTPGPGAIRSSGSSNEDSKGTSGGKVNVEEIR